MQVLVPVKPFRRRLALLARVVPKTMAEPVLETVRFDVDASGGASLTVTNLTSWVRVRSPALRSGGDGAALLPRTELLSILAHTDEAELWLKCDADEFQLTARRSDPSRRLVVSGLRTEATLRTFRPEDYPRWEVPEAGCSHELAAGRLRRLIRRTIYATDPACTRYTLGGCQVELAEDAVEFAATDGLRLAHAREPAGRCGPATPPAAFVPGDRGRPLAPVIGIGGLRLLSMLLEELCDPLQPVRLGWMPDARLYVEAPELLFAGQQLPGRFPNWAGVFPEPGPRCARWPRAERPAQAFKQARALAGPGRRSCSVALGPGCLVIRVETSGSGASSVTVPCAYEGERVEAEFNPALFLDVLTALGAEPIALELNGPDLPAVLLAEGFRYCLQPRPPTGSSRSGPPGHDRCPPADGQG